MTTAATLPAHDDAAAIDAADVMHVVCSHCNPDTALCGTDVTQAPWADNLDIDEPLCRRCVEHVDNMPCCGARCVICDAMVEAWTADS